MIYTLLDAPARCSLISTFTFHLYIIHHPSPPRTHNGRKFPPHPPDHCRLLPTTADHADHADDWMSQKLRVLISMELEGVTNVQPADDHYEYFFTVSRDSPGGGAGSESNESRF